jgi:predicted alpha/beta hydrolase family esterase
LKRIIISLMLIVAGCVTSDKSIDPIVSGELEGDVTESFRNLLPTADADFQKHQMFFQKVQFIFVSGINVNRGGESFREYKKTLRRASVVYNDANGSDYYDHNSTTSKIIELFNNTSNKIVIVSHGLGGLAVVEALSKKDELIGQLAGWIAFQSPFAGTPVADEVNQKGSVFGSMTTRFLGGRALVSSLGMDYRSAKMDSHSKAINKIGAAVTVLSIVAHKKNVSNVDTPFEESRNWLSKKGIKSDGIVPIESAKFPDEPFILFEGTDHLDLLKDSVSGGRFKEISFRTFLMMIFYNR